MKKYPQGEVDKFCLALSRKISGSKYQDGRIYAQIKPCLCWMTWSGQALFHMEQESRAGALRFVTNTMTDHKKRCKDNR